MTRPSRSSSDTSSPIGIVEFFKIHAALVSSAVAGLGEMQSEAGVARHEAQQGEAAAFADSIDRLRAVAVQTAIAGDNLLVATSDTLSQPLVLCAVGRLASGAIDLKTIELDRDEIAIAGASKGAQDRPLDALFVVAERARLAMIDPASAEIIHALDAFDHHVRGALSRLSLIKARLDLQESFLTSVLDPDRELPQVRLESHLNAMGARDLAMEAGRLLAHRTLTNATDDPSVLTTLCASAPAHDRTLPFYI